MNLVEVGENIFRDENTDTTFQFYFNYRLSMKEADRRIYAHFREWQEVRPKDKFYGRWHPILQTGDTSGLQAFVDSDLDS